MASDVLTDETFFDGPVTDINLLIDDNNPPVATQVDEKKKKRSRKSKTPTQVTESTQQTKPPQKENTNSGKTDSKKTGRTSNTKREPLKVLNSKDNTPEDGDPSSKERKSNTTKDSPRGRAAGKPDRTMPKIVVFQNGANDKVQKKRKPAPRLSKSCDSSAGTERKSLPGGRKSQNSRVSSEERIRHSFSDITSVKPQNKTGQSLKNTPEYRKTPAKPTAQKTKPPEPEYKENISKLETIFPRLDPDFIKTQLAKFKGSFQETMEFLFSQDENELPTREDYLRRCEAGDLQQKFLENFNVEEFVAMFPDPWEHFLKTDRPKSSNYVNLSLHYLKSKYRKHYVQAIQEALTKNDNNLYLADKELSRKNRLLKMRSTNRSKYECEASRPANIDTEFMHEVAFIENEKQIKSHLKKAEIARHKKFREAEKSGTLLECLSCNNFSLLQDDAVNCPAHHVFCKDCLIKYVKVEVGINDFRFKCLVKCEETFSLDTLQCALTPPAVARIVERNKMDELRPQGIENLVYCPFCYHVFIIPPEIAVLKCVNPACAVESCRTCKKPNHAPWNCADARQLVTASLNVEESERPEEENRKNGESEQSEQKESESDFFIPSTQADGHFEATTCSVCHQPPSVGSHTDDETCSQCSQCLSDNSDYTECGDVADGDECENFSMEFLP